MIPLSDEAKAIVDKRISYFLKVLKNSLKIKNESILIITDYGLTENNLAPMLAYGYHQAARSKNFNTNVLIQEVKKGFMHADEHVSKALHALDKNSVIIVTASNKIGRIGDVKSFRNFCKDQGHRFISATGLGDVKPMHFDIFLEAMNVNYKRMKKKGLTIKKAWDKAKEIRIKTEAGTDVTFDVTEMKAIANIGEYHGPGTGGNMPAGEVYIPPKGFNGVSGVVVIDGSMKTEKGAILLEEPLKLTVEEGRVIKVEGKQAELLENTFEKFENRAKYPYRVRHVCELGVGINPGAVLIGSTIMDEKVIGTAHIALGSNYWFGGEIRTIFHGDMVFKDPTFYIDGEKMKV